MTDSESSDSSRTVRPFVSSTFQDMKAEREELVKFVFPRLRGLCDRRGVTWGEVDLRWGITDEEKAEGKVLPICLAEIGNSRPYFIGLLGERYGSFPREIRPDLIDQEPWLVEHPDKSVTELEIVHGVLNNPGRAKHAYFYFRDPSYAESLPPDQRQLCEENLSSQEVQALGSIEASRRCEDRKRKLQTLKARIRGSGRPVREDYPNPKALGQLVLADFTEVINTLFSDGRVLDPLDREGTEHETFARSRARVYVSAKTFYVNLDAHAAGDGPPLVILGESGSGKSALLANWALERAKSRPQEFQLLHFIGATRASADWAAMLRRMLGEFSRKFDLTIEIPDQPEKLRATFANALHMAAAKERVVLILDALNQLEDRDQAPDLVWLPPELPPNIRLFVSTLPGRPHDDLTNRGWPTLEVRPLEEKERRKLIGEYLSEYYSKRLGATFVERLAGTPQAANPLYLRALLEEVRLWGEQGTLERRIDHYLEATSAGDLYTKILARYEEDYQTDRPGLVRDAMSLLWASRRGLSEAELLDMLGTVDNPLPGAIWSPLYLAAEQALVNRGGLITFGHDFLRQAVAKAYVSRTELSAELHQKIAIYFSGRDLERRKLEELPWQLAKSRDWQRLNDLLSNERFFQAAWKASEHEVKAYWAEMETGSTFRIVPAYQTTLNSPDGHDPDYIWNLGGLLRDTGHLRESLVLHTHLVKHLRRSGDLEKLAGAVGNEGIILRLNGRLDDAMSRHKEQERICIAIKNERGRGDSICGQAIILKEQGDPEEAMRLYQNAREIYEQLNYKTGVAVAVGGQAVILISREDFDRAMPLLNEQKRIYRERGDQAGLALTLGNEALILSKRGDLETAMRLHEEEEKVYRALGDRIGLQHSLAGQGEVLHRRGDLGRAMVMYKEVEQTCRELKDYEGLAISLANQAWVLGLNQIEFAEALARLNDAHNVAIQYGYQSLANEIDSVRARIKERMKE
jgi:tetratricopeptide (TPR) repeat protein